MARLKPGLIRILVWLVVAAVLTWPVVISPSSVLLGDPRIDVWNHAWGYWFVQNALSEGTLPFFTELVGAPEGGTLYYIDTPGALWALPVTALFGPAVDYNLVLLCRVALAGLSGQILAAELTGKGRHTWLAGLAYATTPFLLCELANGISEVCATHWLALTLAFGARALRTARWQDFFVLGLLQGMTTVTTFYYGLTSAILVGGVFLVAIAVRGVRTIRGADGPGLQRSWLWTFPLTTITSFLISLPHGIAFYGSLKAEDGLVKRDTMLNDQLIRHNAVDPAVYITPGDFQSVDLLGEYGEPFIHTGYLRWSVLLLVLLGAVRSPRLRPWLVLMLFSLVLGLGPYLWWSGDWVTFGGNKTLSLPFDWLRRVMPAIAITHPLRLSLGGQALSCALAAGGLAAVLSRPGLSETAQRAVLVIAGLLVAGEGMLGSAATWPIPTSDARIAPVYSEFKGDDRAVLDLPAEVGTSMLTSRYFWHQTAHTPPNPYTPDVRLGSTRDLDTFQAFMKREGLTRGMEEEPSTPDEPTVRHMRQTYAAVVLHPDFEALAGLDPGYAAALTPALGEPEEIDGLLVWRLEPIETKGQTAEEAAAEEAVRREKKGLTTQAEPGQKTVPARESVGCDEPQRLFSALVQAAPDVRADLEAEAVTCGEAMAEVCRKRLRNPASGGDVLETAVTLLSAFGNPDDAALIEKTWATIGPQ
ncbi:MAG: hypothetical protein ACI8RZ_003047 [Myxococcota bacterium]